MFSPFSVTRGWSVGALEAREWRGRRQLSWAFDHDNRCERNDADVEERAHPGLDTSETVTRGPTGATVSGGGERRQMETKRKAIIQRSPPAN